MLSRARMASGERRDGPDSRRDKRCALRRRSPLGGSGSFKFLEEAYRAHEVKGALPAVTDLNTVLAEKANR